MSYRLNTILSLHDNVNQLNLIFKNLVKIQQLWEERLEAPHCLYYTCSLVARVLSLEKRSINSSICAESVRQDLPGKLLANYWRDWLLRVWWYCGCLQSCIFPGVWKSIVSCYKRSPEFLFFLTFIINAPKLFQFSNLHLNLPKKTYRKVIICNSSNEDFLLCLFLFSYVVLTHTGLVSTGN